MSNIKSRRQRNRNKEQTRIAQERIRGSLREEDESLPSQYGAETLQVKEKNLGLVGVVRESRYGHALRLQIKALRRAVKKLGFVLVKVFAAVETGWKLSYQNRKNFHTALDYAKKHGLALVSLDFTRFLRHSEDHTERPSVPQLAKFFELTEGVQLYTINHVDAHPCNGESFLRERMVETRGGKIGAPFKPEGRKGRRERRKQDYLVLARRLRVEGWSYQEIALEVSRLSSFPITAKGIKFWLENGEQRRA